MKKFGFLLSFLMMALCVGFTSCSDDDDEKGGQITASIVGTWQSTWESGYEIEDGEKDEWSEEYTEEILTFNADGTATNPSLSDGYSDNFTWKISGNQLILCSGEDVEVYNSKTLNSTTLVIYEYYKEKGYEFYVEDTYKRIK